MPYRASSHRGRLGLVTLLLVALAVAPAALADPRSLDRPSHHLVKGFRNLDPSYDYTLAGRAAGLLRRVVEPHPDRGTPPVPVANDGAAPRPRRASPGATGYCSIYMIMLTSAIKR